MIVQQPFDSSLKHLWNDINAYQNTHSIFSTYEWHENFAISLGKDKNIQIYIYKNCIIAPFIHKTNTLQLSGGIEVSDYMDIIGQKDIYPQAWNEIIRFAKRNEISFILLNNIPETSPTYQFFSHHKKTQKYSCSIEHEDTTPMFDLPETWDTYLLSLKRKHRHELRRKIRKFENDNKEIYIHEENNSKQSINKLILLMKRNPNKQSFFSPQMEQFFLGIPTSLNQHVSLRSLKIGNEIIAMTLSFIYHNTMYLYNSGFNDSSHSGSGFYLKAKNIQDAIEKNITRYNFLQGNERYKYELGGKNFHVYSINITL
ncbi:GNAT family N-acetyltransferase [Patescibacteria group bacterium]